MKYKYYFVSLRRFIKQVDNPRGRCVLRSGNNTNANYGFVNVNANNDASNSNTNNGARLTSKIHTCLSEADCEIIVPIHQCRVH